MSKHLFLPLVLALLSILLGACSQASNEATPYEELGEPIAPQDAPKPQEPEAEVAPAPPSAPPTRSSGGSASSGFEQGELTYHFPDSMDVAQVHRVEMAISKNLDQEVLRQEVRSFADSARLEVSSIQIDRKMTARLVDPSPTSDPNFHISALGSPTQFVSLEDGTFTLWQWDVTPLKPGSHPLYISVEIIIVNELGEMSRNIPVLDKLVYVKAQERSLGERLSDFAGQNLEWLVTGLLLPFLGWLGTVLVRRGKAQPKPD